MSGPCSDCGGPDYQILEARITALEAENKKAVYGCCEECRALSEAEAEMEKWKQEVHRIRMCYPGGRGEELLSETEAERNKWEWVARDIAGAFPRAAAILIDAISRWQPHEGGEG